MHLSRILQQLERNSRLGRSSPSWPEHHRGYFLDGPGSPAIFLAATWRNSPILAGAHSNERLPRWTQVAPRIFFRATWPKHHRGYFLDGPGSPAIFLAATWRNSPNLAGAHIHRRGYLDGQQPRHLLAYIPSFGHNCACFVIAFHMPAML